MAEQMEPRLEERTPEHSARPESVARRHSQPLRDRAPQPACGRSASRPHAPVLVPAVMGVNARLAEVAVFVHRSSPPRFSIAETASSAGRIRTTDPETLEYLCPPGSEYPCPVTTDSIKIQIAYADSLSHPPVA